MNTLRFQLDVCDRWARNILLPPGLCNEHVKVSVSWSVTVGQGLNILLLPGLCNERVKVSVSSSVTVGQGIGHSFTAKSEQ